MNLESVLTNVTTLLLVYLPERTAAISTQSLINTGLTLACILLSVRVITLSNLKGIKDLLNEKKVLKKLKKRK